MSHGRVFVREGGTGEVKGSPVSSVSGVQPSWPYATDCDLYSF